MQKSFDDKQTAQNQLSSIDNKIYKINTDNIPNDLKELPNWIFWKYEAVEQGDKFVLSKVPYQVNNNIKASTTDQKTWSSFENAEKHKTDDYGLGFVFSPDNDILGIDIDNCIQEKKIPEDIKTLLKKVNTYKEASVSLSGIHVIGRGQLPDGKGRKFNHLLGDNIHVEIYQQSRYFTVSSIPLTKCLDIINIQELIDDFVKMHENKSKSSTPSKTSNTHTSNNSDDKLLDKIRKSKQGQKFSDLYDKSEGWKEYYPSQSEADLALTCMLRWWTAHDKTKTETMFRQSKLYREKYERDDIRDGLWNKAQQFIDTQYNDKSGYDDPNKLTPLFCLERSPDKIDVFFEHNPDTNVTEIITYDDDYRIFVKYKMKDKIYTISFSDYLAVKFKMAPMSSWKRKGRKFASKGMEGVKGFIILNNAAASIVGNTGNWNNREQRKKEAQDFYNAYKEQSNDKN